MVAHATLDGDRIRIADAVLVYLERAIATPGVVPLGTVPRPHGALPLAFAAVGNSSDEMDAGASGSANASSDIVTMTDDIVIAPDLPGEAVWLGFQAIGRGQSVIVRVRIDESRPVDAVTGEAWEEGLSEDPRNYLVCPADTSLAGRRVPGGRRLFGSDAMERFTLFGWGSAPSGVTVQLLPPAQFSRISGRTVYPLDPAAAFSGRRLP